MGGAAKHLMQLYHDHELSFKEIHEIFQLAGTGQLQMFEKLDGMNTVFTWCPKIMSPKFARNDGDIASGGMDRQQVSEKFRGRGNIETAFLESYDSLELGLRVIPVHVLEKIFNFGKRWFSAEILGPINPNIVHYDSKKLVLHKVRLHSHDESFDHAFVDLVNLLPKINRPLKQLGWQMDGPIPIKLKLMDPEKLKLFKFALSNLAITNNMSFDYTVSNYTWKNVCNYLIGRGMSSDAAVIVTDRIVGSKSCYNLRELKKMFPCQAQLIDEVVKDDWNVFKRAQEPLTKLVDEFASTLMRDARSAHISDNESEVLRLQETTRNEIEELQKLKDPKIQEFLKEHMNLLGSPENINTPIEGVVFTYNLKNYKFTGSFSAANRILGYRRYGR